MRTEVVRSLQQFFGIKQKEVIMTQQAQDEVDMANQVDQARKRPR